MGSCFLALSTLENYSFTPEKLVGIGSKSGFHKNRLGMREEIGNKCIFTLRHLK